MGRNNADFEESALYHGTVHPFNLGDVVIPKNYSHAFATDSKHEARAYADSEAEIETKLRGETVPARVFTVEPVDQEENLIVNRVKYPLAKSRKTKIFKSQKGFKITGELNG